MWALPLTGTFGPKQSVLQSSVLSPLLAAAAVSGPRTLPGEQQENSPASSVLGAQVSQPLVASIRHAI